MKTYSYKARTKKGEIISGQIEAENEQGAANILLKKDLLPVAISLVKETGITISIFQRVSAKEKVFFMRQFSALIKAGLPLAQSLATLTETIKNPLFKRALEQVLRSVEGGTTLSKSMADFPNIFSPIELSLIEMGETSGSLDKVLVRIAEQLEKNYELRRKIKSAMYYPAFIFGAVILLVFVIMIYVVPKMDELYKEFNAQLPFLTQMVIFTSRFVTRLWWLIIVVFIAAFLGLRTYIKNTPQGRKQWDTLKIKAYLIKDLYNDLYLARFNRVLSTMIGSGISVLDGLRVTADSVGNVVYQEAILRTLEKVKGGTSLEEAILGEEVFPYLVPQMVAVGEKTGEVDQILINLAQYYEDDLDSKVKGLTSIMEPAMILLMGGIVGTIIIAVILPIYNLVQVIGK